MHVAALDGFFGELEKIAAAKWRTMLRLGELGPAEIARLQNASRPGNQGKLLDYAREIAGLERGNTALSKAVGIPIQGVSARQALKDVVGGVRKAVKGEPKPFSELRHQVLGGMLARMGGGARNVPGLGRVYVQKGVGHIGKGLKGQDSRAMTAAASRHELDEVRAGRKWSDRFLSGKKDKADVFETFKTPKTIPEKILNKQNDILRKATPDLQLPPRGKVPATQHASPEVVMREGEYLPMLPKAVTKKLAPHRVGESEVLGRHGYVHGQLPSKKQQRDIMSRFYQGRLE